MATKSIDIMLTRPGIYVVVARAGVNLCEVEDGRCYQLTLDTMERDGELPPGRWHPINIKGILGPFAKRLPGDDVTADQCIELAGALEQRRAVEIVKAVHNLPIGGREATMPTPFQAGYCAACEEIDYRLRTEVWAHCLPPMGLERGSTSTVPCGVPAFDATQLCALEPGGDKLATMCPRCKNPHHRCDRGGVDTPVKGRTE